MRSTTMKSGLTRVCVLWIAIAVAAGLLAGGPARADAGPHGSAKAGPTKRPAAGKRKSAPRRHQLRIINGIDVGMREFPWAAFIRFQMDGGSYRCTGTVIKPTFVLTAGHCALHAGRVIDAASYTVTVGRENINDTSTGRTVRVSRVIPHPDFYALGAVIGNDLALLQLAEPVSQTPATMVAPDYFSANVTAGAVGWGQTEQGTASDTLKGAVLSLFKDDVCSKPSAYGAEFDGSTMLCAGTLDGSRDTCFGDSGGPLMALDEAQNWKLVGVTSFGPPGRCAVPDVPGVYAYLGNAGFQRWIAQVTSPPDATHTDPGPNPGGGPAVAPGDSTAPIIQTLAMPSRFRAARRGASMAMRIGATVRYRLSEAAVVRFTVRRAGGRSSRALRGVMVHSGRSGANRFAFTGRMGARKLSPGRYQLVARATDAAGNSSVTERIPFQVIR